MHESDYFEPRPKDSQGAAPLVLGCMNFGKRTPKAEALQLIAHALEQGLGLFDTANAYNDGESERILGEAMKGKRERFLVATKVGFGRTAGKPEGLSAQRIEGACDESLQRLGTDYVDLYYLHVPDHGTPIEESLEAVAGLLLAKKIRRWGVSNYASWQILEMLPIAERLGMPRPAVAQQLYNPLIRQLDVEYFRFAAKYRLHTTIYNPLAGGLLSGKHLQDRSTVRGSRFDNNPFYQKRYWSDAFFAAEGKLARIAESEGKTLVQLAYAWAFQRPGVDSVLVGPGTKAHLDAALEARSHVLSKDALGAIDTVHRELVGTDTSYAR
jgi:aryl-alcohol dehydrogenase-like predicted oxidoreductase